MNIHLPPINLWNINAACILMWQNLGSGTMRTEKYGCYNGKHPDPCTWPKVSMGIDDPKCVGCTRNFIYRVVKDDRSVAEKWYDRWHKP